MLDIPADPAWQRAVLVVLVHCGQVTPLDIAAEPLHQARLEVDAEPLPLQQPQAHADGRMRGAEARAESGWSEEHRYEARFQQHSVGLIGREVTRCTDECEEAEPADEQ